MKAPKPYRHEIRVYLDQLLHQLHETTAGSRSLQQVASQGAQHQCGCPGCSSAALAACTAPYQQAMLVMARARLSFKGNSIW